MGSGDDDIPGARGREPLLVQLIGQKTILYSTLLPVLSGQIEKYWRGRKDGEVKRILLFCFVLVFICLLDCLILFCVDFFKIFFWGHCRDERRI